MEENKRKQLQIYWKQETGIVYRNGDTIINEGEARAKVVEGEYSEIVVGFDGIIPVARWMEMQEIKGQLEAQLQ